jgi:hypothetical protein
MDRRRRPEVRVRGAVLVVVVVVAAVAAAAGALAEVAAPLRRIP